MSRPSLLRDLATRLVAVVASLAHAVDRIVRWPLRRIGLGFVPGALLAGGLLLVLALTTAVANLEAYEARPAPQETTLGAVNQGTVSSGLWVEFDALLVDEPHRAVLPIFDSGVQVDAVVRHYYLARNPREPAAVIVVRSALDPDRAVVRTVSATVERDEATDAAGLHEGGSGVVLDTSLVLVETGDAFAALEAAEQAVADEAAGNEAAVELLVPSMLAEAADGEQVTVRGRIVAHAPAGDDHLYLFADPDGAAAVVLRSAHPPDALPVRIDGTLVIDAFNLENVLAEWRPEERHGELEISDRRLLALGVAPAFVEPSWWPAIVPALAGVLLGAGALLPYPVFRPAPGPAGARAAAEARARGEIPVRIDGRLPVPHGTAVVEDVAGRIEWLPVEEVARIRWRYWGAQLGDYRRDVEEAVRAAGEGAEQLVVHSPVGSMLWPVPADGRVAAEPGLVYRWLQAVPALRLRAEGVEVHLAFGSVEQRDRALAAVRAAS